jgi:hypothetical protein
MPKVKQPREGEFICALPYTPSASAFTIPLVCDQCDELLDRWKSRLDPRPGRKHVRLQRYGPYGLLWQGREEIQVNSAGAVCGRLSRPAIYEVVCEKCPPPGSPLHFRALVSDLIEKYVQAAEATNMQKSEMQIVLSADGSTFLRRGRKARPTLQGRYPQV